MKSTATGQSIARMMSAVKMTAPLRTVTSRGFLSL